MTFIRDCNDNACHTLRSCPSLCGAARPVREDEPCFGPTRNKAPALSEGNRGSAVHVRGISATDEGCGLVFLNGSVGSVRELGTRQPPRLLALPRQSPISQIGLGGELQVQ